MWLPQQSWITSLVFQSTHCCSPYSSCSVANSGFKPLGLPVGMMHKSFRAWSNCYCSQWESFIWLHQYLNWVLNMPNIYIQQFVGASSCKPLFRQVVPLTSVGQLMWVRTLHAGLGFRFTGLLISVESQAISHHHPSPMHRASFTFYNVSLSTIAAFFLFLYPDWTVKRQRWMAMNIANQGLQLWFLHTLLRQCMWRVNVSTPET